MFYVSFASAIAGYGVLLVLMFTNMSNIFLLFLPAFFIFAANGMLSVLTTVFLANTVDYGELKNNRRDESVIFFMQTFVVKLASGVAAFAASVCLSLCNLSNDTSGAAVEAAAGSVVGLRMTMTVIPIAGLLVAVYLFYKKYILTEQKVEEIAGEVKKRRGYQRAFYRGDLCGRKHHLGFSFWDALCRAEIQNGYSYGYPMSVVSAHVSACPNHQTLRNTPLETRFHVAAFGVCGYECNFCEMKKEELEAVKGQISLYKQWRRVLQFGDFYRGRSFCGLESNYAAALRDGAGNSMEWTCVSKDKKKAVGFLKQKLVVPNTQFAYYNAKGLVPGWKYHFYNRSLTYNVKDFGSLVNTVAPVHIRQDSVVHNLVAKFVKMPGETEDYEIYGDALMYGGVLLKQGFGGTGYKEEVRHFPDFGSRMYFMEAVEKTEES